MKKLEKITVPSFFWENFLEEKFPEYAEHEELKKGQQAADRIRNMVERFNDRIEAVRQNPTATEPQKKLQVEKIANKTKTEFENAVNSEAKALNDRRSELQKTISRDIADADRIAAMETRQKMDRMSQTEKISFLRRLDAAGDWESLKHVLGRSAAFLDIPEADFADARRAFVEGKHPDISQTLEITGGLMENLKKGGSVVLGDFDNFQSGITAKAEAAAAALKE